MMNTITLTPQMLQRPALPWEITDAIIDHLHSDIRALGVCSSICSEWLIRSRHHIFSTVQLWPWRVRRFFDLASQQNCTFTSHVSRIEVDDSRARSNGKASWRSGLEGLEGSDEVRFSDAMSQSDAPCLAQVKTIQVRNVDWTALSSTEQAVLRERLAKFSKLNRLEFQDVVFHDLREVVRIVGSFPILQHLTANVSFMKYLEHTVASAVTLELSSNLHSVEIGTDDAIPVVLSCIAACDGPEHVRGLQLRNIKQNHLQYVHRMLKKSGKNIQNLMLDFSYERCSWIGQGMYH